MIGKTIEMKGEPFTVIGLIARKAASQPVINSMDDYYRYMSNDGSGMVCVPDTVWPTLYQYDEPQNVVVRATSTDDMTKAGKMRQRSLILICLYPMIPSNIRRKSAGTGHSDPGDQ